MSGVSTIDRQDPVAKAMKAAAQRRARVGEAVGAPAPASPAPSRKRVLVKKTPQSEKVTPDAKRVANTEPELPDVPALPGKTTGQASN